MEDTSMYDENEVINWEYCSNREKLILLTPEIFITYVTPQSK
jgi:hypothetical protein